LIKFRRLEQAAVSFISFCFEVIGLVFQEKNCEYFIPLNDAREKAKINKMMLLKSLADFNFRQAK